LIAHAIDRARRRMSSAQRSLWRAHSLARKPHIPKSSRHSAGEVRILAGLAVLLVGIQHKAQANDDWFPGSDQSRILIGFKIAPPAAAPGTAETRGSLVWAATWSTRWAAANDCHTNPSYAAGGDPFLGRKGGQREALLPCGRSGVWAVYLAQPDSGRPEWAARGADIRGVQTDYSHRRRFGTSASADQPSAAGDAVAPTYQEMSDNDLRAGERC